MTNLPETSTAPSDEISLKELIQKLQATLAYLWGHKGKLALMAVLGGALGFGYAHFFKKVTYTSRLTFVVEEKSAGGGSLMGLASQFGVDLGGGGGSMFSSDNLILLLRSQKILETALLEPLPALNNDHLLNAYIRQHYAQGLKEGKVKLFDLAKDRADFNRAEDSTLAVVVANVQKITAVSKLDKKASIIDLQLTDTNEEWAYLMSQLIIAKATDMYLDLKTGKTSRTVGMLENRVDSVKSALDGMMSAAAVETDQNQALVRMQARVPAAKKQMQIQMLTAMYGELVKNLELTRFTLDREEPVIQIIDAPSMPLKKAGQGRLLLAVLGSFLLTVLLMGWLLAKSWWQGLVD
jgi:uncharacterized protein involved in exopolysaccharide biosynthesis